MKEIDLGEPTSFLDLVCLACTQGERETSEDIVDNYKICSNPGSVQEQKKKYLAQGNRTQTSLHGPMICKVMQRNVWSDIVNLANRTTQQLYKVATPCLDDHQFTEEELGSVGELSKVCSQIVLKCLYLALIGGPDIPWSVNKLARAVTKRTRACARRLARLISYIQHPPKSI